MSWVEVTAVKTRRLHYTLTVTMLRYTLHDALEGGSAVGSKQSGPWIRTILKFSKYFETRDELGFRLLARQPASQSIRKDRRSYRRSFVLDVPSVDSSISCLRAAVHLLKDCTQRRTERIGRRNIENEAPSIRGHRLKSNVQ